ASPGQTQAIFFTPARLYIGTITSSRQFRTSSPGRPLNSVISIINRSAWCCSAPSANTSSASLKSWSVMPAVPGDHVRHTNFSGLWYRMEYIAALWIMEDSLTKRLICPNPNLVKEITENKYKTVAGTRRGGSHRNGGGQPRAGYPRRYLSPS